MWAVDYHPILSLILRDKKHDERAAIALAKRQRIGTVGERERERSNSSLTLQHTAVSISEAASEVLRGPYPKPTFLTEAHGNPEFLLSLPDSCST